MHHGEYSPDHAVSVLQVVGARPVPTLLATLVDFGFANVSSTPTGFQVRAG
jgi:hypothetical protein